MIYAIILSVPLFVSFALCLYAVIQVKQKNLGKGASYSLLALIILAIIYFSLSMPMHFGCVAMPHFRTNSFTGKCDFGLTGGCMKDPWYFEKGCMLSRAEKIELIKQSSFYSGIQEPCGKVPTRGITESGLIFDTNDQEAMNIFSEESVILCKELL